MWLSRNTEVLDSFPPEIKKFNACSTWSGYSVLEFTDNQRCLRNNHQWQPYHRRQKNYGSYMLTHVHNIAYVNCNTCTYFLLNNSKVQHETVTYITAKSTKYSLDRRVNFEIRPLICNYIILLMSKNSIH